MSATEVAAITVPAVEAGTVQHIEWVSCAAGCGTILQTTGYGFVEGIRRKGWSFVGNPGRPGAGWTCKPCQAAKTTGQGRLGL